MEKYLECVPNSCKLNNTDLNKYGPPKNCNGKLNILPQRKVPSAKKQEKEIKGHRDR